MKALVGTPVLFVLVTLQAVTAWAAPSDAPPAEVVAAAQEGMATFLHAGSGHLARLGFGSQADEDAATLGEGFELLTISPSALLNEYGPQTVRDIATPLSQWQFVVSVRGTPKALLTVAQIDGQWVAVSLGAAVLAKEVSDVLAARPRSASYEHRLVRVNQATSEFMDVSLLGKSVGEFPLGFLRQTLAVPSGKALPPREHDFKEVLSVLRPMVKRRLEMDR